MAFFRPLAGFCLRQVLGSGLNQFFGSLVAKIAVEGAGAAYKAAKDHFTDHSNVLTSALTTANDRAWNALRGALSEGFFDWLKGKFAAGDDKGLCEQIRRFLESRGAEFRRLCLKELDLARRHGLLAVPDLTLDDIAQETGRFEKYSPEALVQASQRFVAAEIATKLKAFNLDNLAELVQLQPEGSPPLLILAFTFCFRTEVRDQEKLFRELSFDILENLSAGQLAILQTLDALSEKLDRIEGKVDAGFEDLAVGQERVEAGIDAGFDRLDVKLQVIIEAAKRAKNGQGVSVKSQAEEDALRQILNLLRNDEGWQTPEGMKNILEKLEAAGMPALAAATREGAGKLLSPSRQRFKPGDALPGRAGWVLDRHLGGGGFGEVWLARHVSLGPRAVKFCNSLGNRDLLHEGNVIARLMDETGRKGLEQFVVPLRDENLDGDIPWLAYDYVEGGSLADAIQHWAKLPPDQRQQTVVKALQMLARAVGHFHRLDPPIVHRDLKPANILYDKQSRNLRITDFGIGGIAARGFIDAEKLGTLTAAARLQSYLHGSYTPIYACPQQKAGASPDPRDDVHALGVIGYQMLTGQLLHGPGSDLEEDLRELGLEKQLIDLLRRCTAQKAERRPKDAN